MQVSFGTICACSRDLPFSPLALHYEHDWRSPHHHHRAILSILSIHQRHIRSDELNGARGNAGGVVSDIVPAGNKEHINSGRSFPSFRDAITFTIALRSAVS